jgi:signal transduction histidine kinase
MSLRLRLVLLTLMLVALVAVALSALQLQTLVDLLSQDTIARASLAGEQTSYFLKENIPQHTPNYPTAETDEQTRITWTAIVENDIDKLFLSRTMIQLSPALLEINVADRAGKILLSSTPGITGTQLQRRERFSTWSQLPWYRRAYDLVTRRPDWEVSPRAIGIGEGAETVFQIQVVTSSLLLRTSLLPPLQRLATIFGSALAVALILALLATHSALRPLQRIERTIDRITQGNFQIGESRGPEAKEFQAVESKLDILGQQVSGSRASTTAPKNLDALVERVATQLDVATRLSAISRLSGGVAHEIKNPLNAILLRLDLLKVRLGDSDEEVSQELAILSKEVLRLNRVVTTFLDFSRPVEVHFEDVDLAALASEVTELIRPQAAMAKIEVVSDAAQPAPMRGDPDLLKQAILNLVTNAVEAMSQNGAQTGGKLKVSVTRSGENWVLEVADTGPGIPPAMRDKVFQLYFTSKAKGSGIGLAMTYRAAQLHNGTISFSSESGSGTTFRVEFPATVTHV